jgi:CTP:molybdopterin cytidylyltransferase MocA
MASIAVVPAAGKGERFGTPLKLLVEVDGEVLLDRTLRCLIDGGVAHIVVVTAPAVTLAAATLLADARVRVVVNPDPSRGMFSSIQAGIRAAEGDPILILPGDMPFVRASTVAALLAASPLDAIVRPTYDSHHGHPIALPGRLRRDILNADPTSTLAAVLRRHADDAVDLQVDDAGVLRDVDTRQDL